MVVSLCKSGGTTEMKYHIKAHEWEQILEGLRTIERIHTRQEAPLRRFCGSGVVCGQEWLPMALAA